MSPETTKVGIVCCSGESIAEGTISRLATRRVLEMLCPETTVTICLPLFVAGNEGERNFARTHPTIAVDGCSKQCARWGTEQHSGPVSGALVVTDILGTAANGCSRSSRSTSKPDKDAVWIVAQHIAAEVDRVLTDNRNSAVRPTEGTECSCSTPVPGGTLKIAGEIVAIPALRRIMAQCIERGLPADESGADALLDVVKIYHRILPEEEPEYRGALLAAYRNFMETK